VTVGAVALRDLGGASTGDPSATVRKRVETARARQRQRFAKTRGVLCNAYASGRWLDARTPVHTGARALLQTAAERLSLSARGYHRVLKVARTIADLEDAPEIAPVHIGEALRYRPIGKPTGAGAAPLRAPEVVTPG
jgi:magnesium chelatase family protein